MFSAFDVLTGKYPAYRSHTRKHDVGQLLDQEIGQRDMEVRI
jgi:hypothetical protein